MLVIIQLLPHYLLLISHYQSLVSFCYNLHRLYRTARRGRFLTLCQSLFVIKCLFLFTLLLSCLSVIWLCPHSDLRNDSRQIIASPQLSIMLVSVNFRKILEESHRITEAFLPFMFNYKLSNRVLLVPWKDFQEYPDYQGCQLKWHECGVGSDCIGGALPLGCLFWVKLSFCNEFMPSLTSERTALHNTSSLHHPPPLVILRPQMFCSEFIVFYLAQRCPLIIYGL